MSDPRRNRLKTYAGVLVSVLLAALAGWVLWRTFQRISLADVLAQMRGMPASKLASRGGPSTARSTASGSSTMDFTTCDSTATAVGALSWSPCSGC